MYSFRNFGKLTQLCNHHHSQDIKHLHHLKKSFPIPVVLNPICHLQALQPLMCFLPSCFTFPYITGLQVVGSVLGLTSSQHKTMRFICVNRVCQRASFLLSSATVVYLLTDGHLGYFQFGVILSKLLQIFVYSFFFW